MTLKDFIRPQMNLWMILLVLLSIVGIDQWVVPKIVANQIQAASDYRTPTHFQYGEVKAYIDLINQDPNPKIILTGDSIIQGGGVKDSQDTITNLLQQEIGGPTAERHVYNLGFSGAAPADIFFVLKALKLDQDDIVVYDLNIGHYISQRLVFPTITGELAAKEHAGQPLYELLQLDKDPIEDRLQLWMTNTWKLYAYRDMILEQFKLTYLGVEEEQAWINYAPWYELDWSSLTKGSAKRGSNDFPAHDPAFTFTKYLVESVRERGAQILVFNIPLNQAMMQKYEMIDRPTYDKNIARLGTAVEERGAKFRDYEKIVPSNFFTDSLHPMKQGNAIIAKTLHSDIGPWLSGEEVGK